ncbi:MAG: 3'-5' exonuclease domain-containing protein 2, partial [Bacteroidia bacterium]|nr:3'-5' exonuclease domain-containing protein 2 [Bacteroidia bacterium]
MFKSRITTDEINNLPVKSFPGQIVLIDRLHLVDDAVSYLHSQPVLGFDTETKPSFKKGYHNSNRVALLQLASMNRAYLFRINKIGLPQGLISLLSDPKIVKVGAAIHDDIKSLQKIQPFSPNGFIDIQHFVKKFGIEHASVKKLSALILNIKISKSQQLSNWETEKFTEAQEIYAATDAWVCSEIFLK